MEPFSPSNKTEPIREGRGDPSGAAFHSVGRYCVDIRAKLLRSMRGTG